MSLPATSHTFLQRERSPPPSRQIPPYPLAHHCPHPSTVPDEKPRPASGKLEVAGKNAKSKPNPKKRKRSKIEVVTAYSNAFVEHFVECIDSPPIRDTEQHLPFKRHSGWRLLQTGEGFVQPPLRLSSLVIITTGRFFSRKRTS